MQSCCQCNLHGSLVRLYRTCAHRTRPGSLRLKHGTTERKTDSLTSFPVSVQSIGVCLTCIMYPQVFFLIQKLMNFSPSPSLPPSPSLSLSLFLSVFVSHLQLDDASCVRLRSTPQPGSSYINASFVNVSTACISFTA